MVTLFKWKSGEWVYQLHTSIFGGGGGGDDGKNSSTGGKVDFILKNNLGTSTFLVEILSPNLFTVPIKNDAI